MENPEQFRFLELPYVPIREVLNMWNPFELMPFSSINAVTKKMTKQFTKTKSKSEISILFEEKPKLTLREFCRCLRYEITCNAVSDDQHSSEFRENIEKCSEDVVHGFKLLFEYVMEIYNPKINGLSFQIDQFSDSQWKSIIDWIKTQSDVINYCVVDGTRASDDVISYLLENLKISNYLDIRANLTENFRGKIPNVSEYLFIDSSKFVTLEQLLKFESRQIIIRNSRLSNQELSRFMTSWMSLESNLNMTVFETSIENQDFVEEILDGIPEEKVILGLPDGYEKYRELITDDGWQLERDDGRTAILYTTSFRDHFLLKLVLI